MVQLRRFAPSWVRSGNRTEVPAGSDWAAAAGRSLANSSVTGQPAAAHPTDKPGDRTPAVALDRRRQWVAAAVRIVFGVIWGIDAWLKWQPGFRATFLPNMIATAAAEPHWLAPWFDFVLRLERPAPAMGAYLGAAVETVIAITLIVGVARRAVYVAGAIYSLLVWTTAGGFGAPYPPGSHRHRPLNHLCGRVLRLTGDARARTRQPLRPGRHACPPPAMVVPPRRPAPSIGSRLPRPKIRSQCLVCRRTETVFR